VTPVTITTAPVSTTNVNSETVVIAKQATAVKTSIATAISSAPPAKSVTVVDDNGYPVIGNEDVLLTITKNTTSQQLEDLKKELKQKGYELRIDKTTYSGKGILTHISGTISSHDGHSDFSASGFEQLILATIKSDDGTHFKIIVKEKPKVII
jgi:hypothetical protein